MKLTELQVNNFQKIYQSYFGAEISFEQAEVLGRQVVTLVRLGVKEVVKAKDASR